MHMTFAMSLSTYAGSKDDVENGMESLRNGIIR